MPVTQWAAVRTYWSPISAPPHAYCILSLLPLVYPKSASQGYFPTGASSPPTIYGQILVACPQDDAKCWIGAIDSLFSALYWRPIRNEEILFNRVNQPKILILDKFYYLKAIIYYKIMTCVSFSLNCFFFIWGTTTATTTISLHVKRHAHKQCYEWSNYQRIFLL